MNTLSTPLVEALEQAFKEWSELSDDINNQTDVVPHERGGREFRWQTTEIGHIHWHGDLDILFNRKLRTALVEAGIVETHKWVPESGWTTFRLRQASGINTALSLLRLSYLHKRLRKSTTETERQEYASQLAQMPFPITVLTAAGALFTHEEAI